MKKSLLALAVLGAFAGAAQAQSSVTIYGIIDTGVTYANKVQIAKTSTATGSQFGLTSGNLQGSRLGFKGNEDLGGGLNAIFALEAGFNNTTGANSNTTLLFNRKSWVGLAGGFGAVQVGRQTDFADTISAFTSVNDFGGITGNVGHTLDRLEGTRTNNSVSYTTANFSGLTLQAMYGFGNTAGSTSAGQAFGAGAQYVNGPLALGLNYYNSKQGSTPADFSLNTYSATTGSYSGIAADAGDTAAKVFTLVGSYQFGPARVYGNWSQVKQDLNSALTFATPVTSATLGLSQKANVYEIGTAYSLSAPLTLLAAVQYTTADFAGVSSTGKLTQFNLGSDYALSKRTDIYAFLSNIRASDMVNPGVTATTGSDASQSAVTVGIRHKF